MGSPRNAPVRTTAKHPTGSLKTLQRSPSTQFHTTSLNPNGLHFRSRSAPIRRREQSIHYTPVINASGSRSRFSRAHRLIPLLAAVFLWRVFPFSVFSHLDDTHGGLHNSDRHGRVGNGSVSTQRTVNIMGRQKETTRQDSGPTNHKHSQRNHKSSETLFDWGHPLVTASDTMGYVYHVGSLLWEHIMLYKPLCIDNASGEFFLVSGKAICGFTSSNGTRIWKSCGVQRESLIAENLLKLSKHDKPRSWLQQKSSAIHWINGLTTLQLLDMSSANIAHFSGRALILHHILENIGAYAAPPSVVENILLLPIAVVMERFTNPEKYGSWHKNLLDSVISHSNFTTGSFGDFITDENKNAFGGTPRVHLLHNISVAKSAAERKEFVCFRRAILPGFLKGRLFVDDQDYPSEKQSVAGPVVDGPNVPRDSLSLRDKLSGSFGRGRKWTKIRKEVILIDRVARRIFEAETRLQIIAALKRTSDSKGYKFRVVLFDNMSFREQYESVEGVAMAVGIHGANLVNSILMPPFAVLFELFPFQFEHGMYRNGCNSGLKYFSYKMSTGTDFAGLKNYSSAEQCIKKSHDCKAHYRDSQLTAKKADIDSLNVLFREAIEWADERRKERFSFELTLLDGGNRDRFGFRRFLGVLGQFTRSVTRFLN